MALAVLRLIGEEVRKDRTTRVVAQLPVDVSTFLINEKREWLHRLESAREIDIVLVPDPNMQTPNYSIRRVRDDEMSLPENAVSSYQMAGSGAVELDFQSQADKRPAAAPAAVQPIAPAAPAPAPTPAAPPRRSSGPGFWSRLLAVFGGGAERESVASSAPQRHEERHGAGRPRRDHREDRGGRRPHRGERGPRHDRDRDRDRDRNRNRDRDRHRDGERGERHDRPPRGGESQADASRRRERPAEAPRPPQAAQNPQAEQQSGEGDPQRRRRRRRGRGGRGRSESYRSQDTPPMSQPGNGEPQPRVDSAPPAAMSAAPAADFVPPPPLPQPPAPASALPPSAEPAATAAPKTGSNYTVWSSSPGEGQHFGPKDT